MHVTALPLGAGSHRAGVLTGARSASFVGLCAFTTAMLLFDNLIILKNTGIFNCALYMILAQTVLLAVLGAIGMMHTFHLPRLLAIVAGAVAMLVSIEATGTSLGIAAAIVSSLAMALLSIAWGNRLTTMPPRQVMMRFVLSALVGSALCFACFLAPARIAEGALFCTLLLACLPWITSMKDNGTIEPAPSKPPHPGEASAFALPVSALVAIGSCCLVCAFFSGATMNPYAIQSSTVSHISFTITILVLVAALATLLMRKRISLNGALFVTLVLLLGSLLMLSTGIAGSAVIPIGVIGAVRTLLWITSFIVLAAIANANPDRAIGVFALGLLVGNGALGRGIGIIASGTDQASFTDLALVGTAAIVAITLVYALINASPQANRTLSVGFDLGFKQQNEQAGTSGQEAIHPTEALYAELLSDIGLTEKEMQVALLVIDDRTYPFIAEKLEISERTVKYHAANIYRKAGVPNKAEFHAKYHGSNGPEGDPDTPRMS